MAITIHATVGDGKTLDQFAKLIEHRQNVLHESAKTSIIACAINALKSLRTITKVAKPSGIKVKVTKVSSLKVSCTSSGRKKTLCLRDANDVRYTGREKLIVANKTSKLEQLQVFRFINQYNEGKEYLICALTQGEANKTAKRIVARRLLAYAGLAKRAMGLLMFKAHSKQRVSDPVNANVDMTANQVTYAQQILVTNGDKTQGKYALILIDLLRYATDALKGGKPQVDIQLKKAMNKITSIMNLRMKTSLHQKMPMPFPEYSTRKK